MVHPVWQGSIRLGPMQVRVMAHAAIDSKAGRIKLRQIHKACSRPIQMMKNCPEHGELFPGGIVKGFEYSPGKFILFDGAELLSLESTTDTTLVLDKFVLPQAIDPLFFGGRGYYLLPADFQAQSAYRVVHQALRDEDLYGLSELALRDRKKLILVSPAERLLVMSVLHFADAVRPAAMFDANLADGPIPPEQLAQAQGLIRERLDDPQLEQYYDPYQLRLAALAKSKLAKRKMPQPADNPQQMGEVVHSPAAGQNQTAGRRLRQNLANGQPIRSQKLLPRPGTRTQNGNGGD